MIILYSKYDCQWCDKAKTLLLNSGLDYEIKIINALFEQIDICERFSHDTFPVIVKSNGELIGGYAELERYIKGPAATVDNQDGPVLKFKRLSDLATLPERGSEFAAGFDLSMTKASVEMSGEAFSSISIHPGKRIFVDTGLAVEIPNGWYGRIAPRSGLAAKHGINVLAGVIDSDYRGKLVVILHNTGNTAIKFSCGDRIAQLVIEKCLTDLTPVWAPELESAKRGSDGFGSTGT